jgi:hypothetical protein
VAGTSVGGVFTGCVGTTGLGGFGGFGAAGTRCIGLERGLTGLSAGAITLPDGG